MWWPMSRLLHTLSHLGGMDATPLNRMELPASFGEWDAQKEWHWQPHPMGDGMLHPNKIELYGCGYHASGGCRFLSWKECTYVTPPL